MSQLIRYYGFNWPLLQNRLDYPFKLMAVLHCKAWPGLKLQFCIFAFAIIAHIQPDSWNPNTWDSVHANMTLFQLVLNYIENKDIQAWCCPLLCHKWHHIKICAFLIWLPHPTLMRWHSKKKLTRGRIMPGWLWQTSPFNTYRKVQNCWVFCSMFCMELSPAEKSLNVSEFHSTLSEAMVDNLPTCWTCVTYLDSWPS